VHRNIKQLIRKRSVKVTLEIIALALIFLIVKTYLQRDLAQGVAPPFRGTATNGQSVKLQNLRGKPALVYFWATWCPVCKLQNGSVAAISNDHAVITIAMNSGSNSEIEAFLKEKQLNFSVLADDSGIISSQYGVTGVPSSFIIDPAGNIAFTEVGYTTEWGLRLRLWLAN
jgi:peroxiredoxin